MKLSSILSERELSRLAELDSPAPTANTIGATPAGTQTMAPGQQVQQDPAAQAKMMAQQALDRQNQKKQIQDQIKAKQEEIVNAQRALQDLQKQLATIK
jgi:cytochrome c1